MKPINYKSSAIIAVLLAVISCFAQANNSNSIKTVEQLYPNLATGVLTYAKVFYDNSGKEFYRHSGFYSEKDIINKLSEMGIQ